MGVDVVVVVAIGIAVGVTVAIGIFDGAGWLTFQIVGIYPVSAYPNIRMDNKQ